MNWLQTEIALLDAAVATVGFAFNWLLQSTLVIAAGLACGWLMRRRGSALQSAVYRTTLVAALVCPLATSLLALCGVSGWSVEMPVAWTYEQVRGAAPVASAAPPRTMTLTHPQALSPPADNDLSWQTSPLAADTFPSAGFWQDRRRPPSFSKVPANAVGANPLPVGVKSLPVPANSRPEASRVTAPAETWLFEVRGFGLAAIAICLAWCVGSAVLLLRLGLAWQRLNRLRSGAAPAEDSTQQACRELAKLVGVSPPPVLRSPYLASPCLAGLVRPAVLLPEADVALPVRDVLIHELAHLRRCDCFWNLLRRVMEAVFFYQPLVWMLARRLETAAEEVCDDYVVQLGGDREGYARRLVDLAELSALPAGAAGVAMVSLRSILAKRVARIMDTSRSLSTRAGNLLLVLVMAGGLTGTMLAGLVGLGPRPSVAKAQADDDGPAEDAEATTNRADGQKANDATFGPAPPGAAEQVQKPGDDREAKSVEQLHGRVTGAKGKPVAGAKLYWIRSRVHDLQPQPPILVATTGDDGAFRFTPPRPHVTENDPASWDYSDRIVVTAPGHGFTVTWPSAIRDATNAPGGLLRTLARVIGGQQGPAALPTAGEPIRGRLVDINGQPVIGATVRIRWFNDENAGRHDVQEAEARGVENAAWQARVNDLLNVIEPVQLRDALPSATTDAEGRFELRDLGPQRLVQLLVEGEGIEATEIVARNEPGETMVLTSDRHEHGGSQTVYPNEFLHAVGPSKPVEGRVLDLDSGEPIADAVVRAFVVHGDRLNSSREREHFATRTDAAGRYHIAGLPLGEGNRLVAFATGDVPYLPVGHAADTSAAATELDFRLKRGVWAEGRVFDSTTDKPFTGELTSYFFRNPELETAIPGLRSAYLDGRYWTNGKGEFRVPVLPTRGVLAFRYDGHEIDRDGIDRFARGFGADDIAGSEDFGGSKMFPTLPHYLMPGNYERVAEVPAAEGRHVVRVEMPLFASPPVTVRVVDAEGNAVTDFQVYGANERFGWQTLEGPHFEILDLRPGEKRKVFVFHRNSNLAGGGIATHGMKETLEIKLVAAGSVQGRLVDAEGEPINDASLFAQYEKLNSDDDSAIWAPHPKLSANPTTIPVDQDGRFRLDGLIPGWTYNANASAPRKYQGEIMDIGIGQTFENVQVQPGEHKDLGDLVIGADERDGDDADAADAGAAAEVEPAAPALPSATIVGRVTGEGGRPVAGAHVAAVGMKLQSGRGGDLSPRGEVLAEGVTDEHGQYELRLAGATSKTHAYASAIARKDGVALAWKQINLAADKIDAPLELPQEETIRGRLIDLEGQPAAGVHISVQGVIARNENISAEQGVGYNGDNAPAAWLPSVVSDEQGRFTLRGVPAGHGVFLAVEGTEQFAPQDIALNTGMAEERGERDATYRPLVENAPPGEEAVLTLAPAQWFEGLVRYADSGEPAPHARITLWASQQEFVGSMVSVAGQADNKGRYRINPRPGIRFGLNVYPPDGVPYLAYQTPFSESIRWKSGERVKQVDLTLPRGVLVRGQVVEAGTGTPVAGATVQYFPESFNNPHHSDTILTGWQGIQLSDPEGNFSIAVLPGPGRLLASASQGSYVRQEIGQRQLVQGQPGGERNYAHAITELNPNVGAPALDVKLELQPGATVKGQIVDEKGNLVEEALVVSRLKIWDSSLIWRGHTTPTLGGRFELSGLAPNVEYPVYFLDAKRRLGATAIIKSGADEPSIVLRPCGQAKLRVVDRQGEPVADHYANVEMVVTPGASRYDAADVLRGELAADADFVANIDRTNYATAMKSDEQGNLTLPALIPGATYRIAADDDGGIETVKEFQVQAGEVKDLGDLTVQP
jgi:beta-lactamase regulating signal transducer with metallopeptidase domain/uncharacterized GH25 family protein